jgi:hypothetical protein
LGGVVVLVGTVVLTAWLVIVAVIARHVNGILTARSELLTLGLTGKQTS